jgi:Alternative oxidase
MLCSLVTASKADSKQCLRVLSLLQEEAVHTYTTLLKEIDSGALPMFEHLGAPLLAIDYWKLPADANFRDLILAVRADEANHRVVSCYHYAYIHYAHSATTAIYC